jgi:hypothetical protein
MMERWLRVEYERMGRTAPCVGTKKEVAPLHGGSICAVQLAATVYHRLLIQTLNRHPQSNACDVHVAPVHL